MKYVWIILLKNDFLDFPRYSGHSIQARWANVQANDVKFFQDLTHQKSLKSVNFWQSYLKNKKVDVFWGTQSSLCNSIIGELPEKLAWWHTITDQEQTLHARRQQWCALHWQTSSCFLSLLCGQELQIWPNMEILELACKCTSQISCKLASHSKYVAYLPGTYQVRLHLAILLPQNDKNINSSSRAAIGLGDRVSRWRSPSSEVDASPGRFWTNSQMKHPPPLVSSCSID